MAFNPAAMLWSGSTITTNDNNVTFGGAITYNTGTPNITKNGTGTLTVTGTQNSTNAANLTVAAGTLNLNTSPGTGLRVNANSTTNFNNGSHNVGTIVVGPSATAKMPQNGNRTMYVNKLTIDSTGALDMADNDLVVNAEAFTTVKSMVLSGFGSPSGGITSSTSDGSQILALFDNTIVGSAAWNGQTISTTATVGKYTYFGDVNLDGQVTGDDYTIVDSNLNTTPPVGIEWLSGDANLDGIVTGDDYTTIDSNLGLGSGNPLSASSLSGAAAVPEPGSIGLIMSAGVSLLLRRRRSAR
jgi:autotransporter-associated beta strand protein